MPKADAAPVQRTRPIDTAAGGFEPSRFPGSVQPHGALLVLSPDRASIEAASESCMSLLGMSAASLVGSAPRETGLPELEAQSLSSHSGPSAPPLVFEREGRRLAARATLNPQGRWLVDIEPDDFAEPTAPAHAYRQRLQLRRLRSVGSVAGIAQEATEIVAGWTGYDRVLIYRFDEHWNGEVIAETCPDAAPPYRGLNFPASDFPGAARELFRQYRVRFIPDAGYLASALVATGDSRTIDLGLSGLRSVSPIHREYLERMGVSATLAVALEIDGRLWGLLACHHVAGTKYLGPSVRDAVAWFCEDLAAHLGNTLLREQETRAADMARRRLALIDEIRGVDIRSLIRGGVTENIRGVVNADGFALVLDRAIHTAGLTPSIARIRRMLDHWRARGSDSAILVTDSIVRDLGIADDDDGVAGAMFVSVQHKSAHALVWFRQERPHTVDWAGDPADPHVVEKDGRIRPRKSLARFMRAVRGQCLPWSAEEQASARELGTLLEIEALRESEAFLQTVLDSSPEHICVLDASGAIVGVNGSWQRFAEANGADPGAVNPIGVSYRDICSAAQGKPDGAEGIAAWNGIDDVLQGRAATFTLDYPCDSPRERRWFQMIVYRMREPREGAVVVHHNVTSRKLAEIALKASEQRYMSLLEDQSELICRFRTDGTILYVNQAFCRFFGKSQEQLAGRHWAPEVVPEDLPDVRKLLAQLDVARPLVTIENRVMANGGQVRWVQFVNRGIFDDRGRLTEIQAVGRDVTERNWLEAAQHEANQRLEHANRQLQQATRDAERANAAKSRFLAAASHDLRQPLTSLSLYVEALARMVNPECLTLVAKIQHSTESLSTLLLDLLDFSKLDAGVVKPSVCTFPVSDLLRGIVLDFSAEAERKGLALRMRPSRSTTRTDPGLLRRLVGNLVVNAIRHTETGGVLVACRHHDGRAWIEVWDTGPGIPADKTQVIFEEFVRLGDATQARGSGLGLAIVARAAQLLQLEVRVRSRVGHGSLFAVELPAGGDPVPRPVPGAAPALVRLRIGLVEDDFAVLDAMAVALESHGHDVVAASTGAELLERAGGAALQVLISDYRLADQETGFEVIRKVRNRYGSDLPAILITGDTDPQTLRTLSDSGIRVCHKPVRMADLLARIAALGAGGSVDR